MQEEERVCYGTRQLQLLRHLVFAPRRADKDRLQSVFLERLRQLGVSEDICHPFEVVGHDCEAEFGVSSYPSAQEEAWMTEDAVFDGREGMFDDRSSQPHRSCGRPFIHSGKSLFEHVP